MKNSYFALLLITVFLSSCDTFLDALTDTMSQRRMYRGYNPMGYMGTTSVAPATIPAFVPGADYTSTPVVSTTSSSSSSYSTSSSTRTCQRCMGTGKCQTCNGRGYYDEIGIGSGRHACPNCASNHNGKCSSCGGRGSY